MPRQPSLRSVKATFRQVIDSSVNLFGTVEGLCKRDFDGIEDNPLHFVQARRVVGLAFLGTVAAWEDFLEASFVRYLAGAASPSGYRPAPRAGYAQSIQHAYSLVSGKRGFDPVSQFLSWSTISDVLARADLFFSHGVPFRPALSSAQQRLSDATRIRNRVAHSSLKARAEFKAVALQHLGRPAKGVLPRAFSPGDLLLETASRGFPSFSTGPEPYFIAYLNLYLELADRIAPE